MTTPRTKQDVFPVTMTGWITERLMEGPEGRREVNRHVMAVYAWPLQVYFMGTRDRWLGEPEEIVQGFFASRLSRDEFFEQWNSSGLKLRHWLMNAFCFFLNEQRRLRKRDGVVGLPADDRPSPDPSPSAAVDRAYVVAVVREALRMAHNQCGNEGFGAHWDIFLEHACCGQPYAELAARFHVDPARAAVMARTARAKFQSALREIVHRDAPDGDADDEIRALLETADE